MIPGMIKLYQQCDTRHDKLLERAKYYTVKERKKVIDYWRRTYNGRINLCYIIIIPGVLIETNDV